MKQRFLRQKSVHIDRKMKRSKIDFIKIKSCTTESTKGIIKKCLDRFRENMSQYISGQRLLLRTHKECLQLDNKMRACYK